MNKLEPSLPKVSIVIPVYNGSNFLAKAIDSALAQTYENIEVVVVDDGSSDDGATRSIALSYGERIKYYTKKNGGVASALNYGIRKMTGDYFSWLSHDDLYEPTKITEQIAYLHEVGDSSAVIGCNAKTLFESGLKQETNIDEQTFAYMDIFLATSAIVGINGCALLIPKKHLESIGGFNEKLPYTQDYDCWYRLSKVAKFYLLPRHLVISRRHKDQDSVRKQRLCYEAAEKLHYGFLNDIPYERIYKYLSADPDHIDRFLNNYNTYKVGGYNKTASLMLTYLLRYYASNDYAVFTETMQSEIGRYIGDSEEILKKSTTPRVVLFSNVWSRGGIERVLNDIFESFHNKYQFILVTCESGSDSNNGFELPSKVAHVKIRNISQLAEIVNLISLHDAAVFIGNPNYSSSFIDIYPILKDMKVRSVAYNHGHYFLPQTTGQYLYPTALKIKEAYNSADVVIWLSKVAYELYSLSSVNGVYIPNSVELTKNKTSTPKRPSKTVVVVGRFDDEVKQIDKALLIFREIYAFDPSYRLRVVGYCPQDIQLPRWGNATLREFIVAQDIPIQSIDFIGEQSDVKKHYRDAGFLMLTSRCEGFALVLLEAMSCGLPCLGLDYLGLDEIITDGKNGWIHQQSDYAGAARSIVDTIDNSDKYQALSQFAIQSVARFDKKSFDERWTSLLHSLTTTSGKKLDLHDIQPSFNTVVGNYKKIIVEYERVLNGVIIDYMNNLSVVDDGSIRVPVPRMLKKVYRAARQMKHSIVNEGLPVTAERVARKLYNKTVSRH